MKYEGQIGGRALAIDLRSVFGDTIEGSVDGRPYRLSLGEVEPGVFVAERDGRAFEIQVDGVEGAYTVRIGGAAFDLRLRDRRALLAGRRSGAAGGANVVAAMPGKVVRVLVEEGAPVEAGQEVVVVEAMKMQNGVTAPGAGRVVRVAVSEGQGVKAGDLLVVIEPGAR